MLMKLFTTSESAKALRCRLAGVSWCDLKGACARVAAGWQCTRRPGPATTSNCWLTTRNPARISGLLEVQRRKHRHFHWGALPGVFFPESFALLVSLGTADAVTLPHASLTESIHTYSLLLLATQVRTDRVRRLRHCRRLAKTSSWKESCLQGCGGSCRLLGAPLPLTLPHSLERSLSWSLRRCRFRPRAGWRQVSCSHWHINHAADFYHLHSRLRTTAGFNCV